jgi:hypothetical protein
VSVAQARQLAEVSATGAVIGVLAGAVVGGLAAFAGQPVGWALTGAVTLAVPLALLGAVYGVLVGLGRAKPGMFAPAALLWFVGFPLARLVHETGTPVLLGGSPTPPDDVVTFLAYQAMVSLGFAIGFTWLYERLTPPWLLRIKEHNPLAERAYARYARHAAAVWEARERKRARRAARTGSRPPAALGTAARSRNPRSS